MGAYASLSDVQDHWGTQNVAAWSDLGGNNTLDSDRVDRAIANAEADINDRFRGSRYTVPFAPVPTAVAEWAAKLAGVRLYQQRGIRDTDVEDRVTAVRERVDQEIADVSAGIRTFDADTIPRAPFVAP